jgi:ATP-dependent Clp protease protease subunit
MVIGDNMSKELVTKDNKFETAQTWLQMGIDLEYRRIQLDMDVSDVMASLVIRALVKMTDISHDPIEIYLSSYGGEIYSGLAIYDAIRACPCDVVIHANGKIMSAASVIYLAADVRVAAKHTSFMLHSVSSGTEGKIKDQEIDVQEGKRLNNVMLDILADRTKMKKNWWYRKILSHDIYFDLTQAKEYGIVSTITTRPTPATKKAKGTTKNVKTKKIIKKPKSRRR